MKKLSLILFLFTFSAFAENTYSSDPKTFISELVDDVTKKLSEKKTSAEEKKKFIEDIVLENVDIHALSLYTLGELRKSTDKNVLISYQKVFQKYFLKSLTSKLTDYSSNKLEVISAEQKSSVYTIVKSKIISNDNQPEIKIDWRVYTKNLNKPLIRDLIVEGLSLARVQKEEFSSILNSNNNEINILIAKLEEFINK